MQPTNTEIRKEAYAKPALTKEGQLKDITAGVPGTLE